MSANEQWANARSAAAAEHLARLQARQEAEHKAAQGMLQDFVRAAKEHGLAPQPLRVRGYRDSISARTPILGWYLRKDRKAGVDTEGAFYILSLPLSIKDRLVGVCPTASPPPLVLGAGGRDGNSVNLSDALERLLPGWSRGRINPCQE